MVQQTLDVPELAVVPQHEREDFFRGDRGEFSIKVKSATRWLRKTPATSTYYTQLILSDCKRPVWVENEQELFRGGARVARRSGFGLQKSGRHGRQRGRVYEVSVKESGYRNGGGGGRLDMLGWARVRRDPGLPERAGHKVSPQAAQCVVAYNPGAPGGETPNNCRYELPKSVHIVHHALERLLIFPCFTAACSMRVHGDCAV